MHHRFWQGWRKTDLGWGEFERELNRIFVPRTVAVGAGQGLAAYQPFLFPESHPAYLPDEIALVSYQSEEAYLRLRATPAGSAYQDLHWDYFDRSRSKSRVPGRLGADPEIGASYALLEESWNVDDAATALVVLLRAPTASPEAFLGALRTRYAQPERRRAQGLRAWTVLVEATHVLEYQSWAAGSASRELAVEPGGPLQLYHQGALERAAPSEARLAPGAGLNARF